MNATMLDLILFWLLVPAGTPRPVVDRLHAALLKALAAP